MEKKNLDWKKIHETSNYLIEGIKHNELMRKKRKRICTTLNYIEHLLTLSSTVTGCVTIFTFVSLVGRVAGIASSALGLRICAITAEIKKFMPVIKKKREKHDKIVLLAKTTISFIILWDLPMFYQIFLSPQAKLSAIINYKHGIYELPHELQNDLRLTKYQESV